VSDQATLAGRGIMLSTCPFVHASVHLLPNLSVRYFENEWTEFDAHWHIWSTDKGMKRSALGIRRSRSYEAEIDVSARYLKKNCLTNFNQTWALAGTYYSECPLHKVKGQGHMTPGFKKTFFNTT